MSADLAGKNAHRLLAVGRRIAEARGRPIPEAPEARRARIDQAIEALAADERLTPDEKARGIRALQRARARLLRANEL